MLFLTDSEENYNQRMAMSSLMRTCGLFEPSDWVLNLHTSGFLYRYYYPTPSFIQCMSMTGVRALDLTAEIIERAGGNVLCAGHLMTCDKLLDICAKYHVNAITGDTSQILNLAHYIDTLPPSSRPELRITKITYTSEIMPRLKRDYLVSVFGPVTFSSLFASAESGPWAVAAFRLTGDPEDDTAADLIFDTRAMKVEVLSLTSEVLESKITRPPMTSEMAPEGTLGPLVLTSLQRLKNPLLRYISGDIGSIHPIPKDAPFPVNSEAREHLKVLRLYGRDQRFSFKWLGEYFELSMLSQELQRKDWGILQWQIVIEDDREWKGSDTLELRLMRRKLDGKVVTDDTLVECLKPIFFLTPLNERLFRATFLDDVREFERSKTSNKVVKFIDKRS